MNCRKLAFDLAGKLKVKHLFNEEDKLTGIDWLAIFKKNPQISIRASEATSIDRAIGFSKPPQVEKFHNRLESSLKKYGFQADQIFNIDECDVNIVDSKKKFS